jgi:pimeloyl-ACP methyl ester carboxylesterase
VPRIQANDISLYCETAGRGQPLLFIHGLGSSTRDWGYQVPAFAKNYQVITFDLRGHGQSDKPAGPYTVPMFADDTAGLLKALGIESAHIVGLSLGGAVAFQLAVAHPRLVHTLTIVNSGPTLGEPSAASKEVERRVGIVQQMGMQAMGQGLSGALFPKPEHAALRQTFVERWTENDPAAYVEATRAMLGWDVTDRLATIKCPALIISADQDYTPVALKEAYVRLMPNARLAVIADAHHATPLEKPEAFNAVLSDFLAQHG